MIPISTAPLSFDSESSVKNTSTGSTSSSEQTCSNARRSGFDVADVGTVEEGIEAVVEPEQLHLIRNGVGSIGEGGGHDATRPQLGYFGEHPGIDDPVLSKTLRCRTRMVDSAANLLDPVSAADAAGDHAFEKRRLKRRLIDRSDRGPTTIIAASAAGPVSSFSTAGPRRVTGTTAPTRRQQIVRGHRG